MKSKFFIPMLLDLQLFAEGGAGASGATGADGGTGASGQTGVTSTAAVSSKATKGAKNPLADVKYGVQAEGSTPAAEVTNVQSAEENASQATATIDRNAEFERLIKEEYKDLYDARVQDTIQKRLKSSKEVVDKYNALTPTLEMLAKKYGVDVSDSEALNRAIEEDDSYYEQEALERGITVQQLKEIRKMERENAELKKQMNEQSRREKAAQDYAAWMEQAKQARLTYPSLDLNTEAKNPQFLRLLQSGVDVGTAYAVIHKDEIIPAAMQYAAKVVEEKTVNNIIAGGARPSENGISSQSASLTKSDVSQLTKADRAEIMRRVSRGEKITFS